ncbi:DICT sensory domain-containing protein [Nocardioides currus]|uniref:DICT sensory domain-containing protein n=1 Tax=Nocardioides currus TaxID=2133958 RepID=UPI001403D78B|nr:DICT sensory domain-containing protein [Nocardioides currus]
MSDEFSIGTLAERTGLTPTVLRAWEQRFDFPRGRRLDSGHRRFTQAEVEMVTEVLAARESGLTLPQAIARVRDRHAPQPEGGSVHAALQRDFPDLRPVRLGRRVLVAASKAIEEEALARADRPLVLGSFQVGHHVAGSQHRWAELARTASWCAVLADFDGEVGADPTASPARCQLPADADLRREWTVVTLSASHAAVLSAWEVPAPAGGPRVFESTVTTRRSAAIAAGRVLTGIARSAGATPPPAVADLLDEPTTRHDSPSAAADRLWLRTLAQLDR